MKAFLILVLLLLSGCGGSTDTTADSKSDPFKSFLYTQNPNDDSQPKALKMDSSNSPSGSVPDPFRAFLDAQKNQTNQ